MAGIGDSTPNSNQRPAPRPLFGSEFPVVLPTILGSGPTSSMELFDPLEGVEAKEREAAVTELSEIAMACSRFDQRPSFGNHSIGHIIETEKDLELNAPWGDELANQGQWVQLIVRRFAEFALRKGFSTNYSNVQLISIPPTFHITHAKHLDPLHLSQEALRNPSDYAVRALFASFTHEDLGTEGFPHLRSFSRTFKRLEKRKTSIEGTRNPRLQERKRRRLPAIYKGRQVLRPGQPLEALVMDLAQVAFHRAPKGRGADYHSAFALCATDAIPINAREKEILERGIPLTSGTGERYQPMALR